jgi:thiol-disulfide isomerase/thioredoxin
MPANRNSLLVSALIQALFLLGACSIAPVAPTSPAGDASPAHAFALTGLDGDSIALADLRGEWVLVNFWATWCSPCRDEMPYLNELHHRSDLPLTVIGVNMREDAADVRAFIEEVGVDMPIVLEPDDQTLLAYDVMGLPVSVVIAPDGSLTRRIVGPIEPATFDAWLVDVVAEFSP